MKTLIFDMYGVIIKESKGNFIPYVYKHFPNTDRNILVSHFNDAGIGKMADDEFIKALGFKDADLVKKDYIENYLSFDYGFIDFVEKFKNILNFTLLSNDVLTWSEYITSYYGIDKYFDKKIISGTVGCRKPDPQIYKYTLDKLNLSANNCIFIDNSVKNLIPANELGIDTILFNRDNENYNGKTVNSFKELSELMKINLELY